MRGRIPQPAVYPSATPGEGLKNERIKNREMYEERKVSIGFCEKRPSLRDE